MTGVTEENMDATCQVIAAGLAATVDYCSLDGPKPHTRRKLAEAILYMTLNVQDAETAQSQVAASEFLNSLSLPASVVAQSVDVDGSNLCLQQLPTHFFWDEQKF